MNIPMTESTELENTSKVNNEESTPRFWQSVLVGGVPGILIGAGIDHAFAKPEGEGPIVDTDETTGDNDAPEVFEIQVAHSVTDDMSFSEAFAAARNEVGPGGAFVWHGNVYGTYRGDDTEWQEMSAEERAEHSQAILSQVHPTTYTPTDNEPSIVEVTEEAPNDYGEGQDEDIDVHIIDVVAGEMEDGRIVPVGVGAVDGHYSEFVDTDGDGEVDTVLIDANDNQVLDEGEVLHGPSGITVDDMIAEVQENNSAAVDDALYGDMPDYTNDADTSSFV